MDRQKSWFVAGLSAAAVVFTILIGSACKRSAPDGQAEGHAAPAASAHADEHGEHGHEALPRHVSVSKEVVASAGIQVRPTAKVALFETLSLPGEVAADPDRLARVSSPTAGRIEAVHFKEGEPIKQGAVLVVIRVPEIAKLRAASAASLAKAKAARANADRLRKLHAEGLAIEQDAVNATAEADALDLDARSSADQLGALGATANGAFSVTLRAPISGVAIAREAVVGQPVSAEQTLGTIADLSQVWFMARVFEKDLGQLRVGAGAEVHLNAYAHEHFTGSVEYIGQQIDPVGRTVTARVRLQNPNGLLRIGLFGTCQVSTGNAANVQPKLVVDQSSVTELAGKSVVFVREREGEFGVHEVTLGREALGKVEVLEGLSEGEQVVSDGVFTLKSLVLKGSFAEEEH
jgi:cobalt-zinc-cadmium efflux system membrane fusion protein